MRILILNWRCPKNPRAGGAELFTHEVAKRLVAAGDQVEWFSASFRGAPAEEDLEGVHIVRAGRQWTVHLHAFRRYHRQLRSRFDLVIDEVNTVPFFTPLWADVPVVMLIFQLAREVWWYESPFPVNLLGFAFEPLYLRLYRRIPVITESDSTRIDLRRIGFSSAVTVVPVGVDHAGTVVHSDSTHPTFLYVGRLAPSKRISDIVLAFHLFRQTVPQARLWLMGDGPPAYLRKLRRLIDRAGLSNSVHFLGRVSVAEKYGRMAEAYALLMASVREGWGLVVTEASACGTPTVAYDVAGLRDSVRQEETGLLVAPTHRALADGMLRIWQDQQLRGRLSLAGLKWSQTLSYDQSAQAVRSTLAESMDRMGQRATVAR